MPNPLFLPMLSLISCLSEHGDNTLLLWPGWQRYWSTATVDTAVQHAVGKCGQCHIVSICSSWAQTCQYYPSLYLCWLPFSSSECQQLFVPMTSHYSTKYLLHNTFILIQSCCWQNNYTRSEANLCFLAQHIHRSPVKHAVTSAARLHADFLYVHTTSSADPLQQIWLNIAYSLCLSAFKNWKSTTSLSEIASPEHAHMYVHIHAVRQTTWRNNASRPSISCTFP